MAPPRSPLVGWALVAAALANAGIGVAFLTVPGVMAPFVDLAVATPTADNDLRAVHGGISSALALFFAAATRRAHWAEPALALATLEFAGLAFGRFLSWAVAGWPAPLALALHAAEIAGLVLCALAWRTLGRDAAPEELR